MALKKTLIITGDASVNLNGVSFTEKSFNKALSDAYIKIENVQGNKLGVTALVSKTSVDRVRQSSSYSFVPDMDGANFVKQAYEYLKTLPEFAGAQDC